MRDTHFVISLANNSHNLSVERCQRFAKMQTSCSPVSDVNPKQHPQFAEGHLYNVGNIEIGILSSKSICKDSDRCAIKIPSFVLRALSQGKTPTLPSLVSVVRLEKSLELLDGERGFQIMKLTSFPAGLAPGRLGKVVRIEAEHRGNLKIEFEQAHLRLNLLEERGVLAASDGDVWSLIEGSHTTRWTQANKT
ncbi:hypothetical protein EBR21_10345, partial [bacterium]|nr:hypothetical protein [bacterium]